MNDPEKKPERRALPPRVEMVLNKLKPGMTNEEVRKIGKKKASYHDNKQFLNAYHNRFSGTDSENFGTEKSKPYQVATTVLNMSPESDSEKDS